MLSRPWGLSRAWWAALGGGAVLATGLVSPLEALHVLSETADLLALLVGMMFLSAVADKGDLLVFVVGCLVSAVLSLDATAIVLTPISSTVRSRAWG